MSVKIKYSSNIQWGTTSAGTLSQGIIISASRKVTSEVYEAKNAQGENHSVIFYDDKEEVSVEVLASASASLPSPGDQVTVAGASGAFVVDAEIKWSNTDAVKISMTLKKWLA